MLLMSATQLTQDTLSLLKGSEDLQRDRQTDSRTARPSAPVALS